MSNGSTERASPEAAAERSFPVVGIGASAGGLAAVSDVLRHLPADTGMAFVIVQHLDPHHPSALTEILSKVTPMKVTEVADGMDVEPDHVYVMSPNTTMAIRRSFLELSPRAETSAQHLPIDYFLHSLAQDRGSQAIAVILSGTASDGALGVSVIKAEGGITFAQDETAKFDGMPRAAIATGCVDFVLPPEGIASQLSHIARHPHVADVQDSSGPELPEHKEGELATICRLLHKASGVDFTLYKHGTLQRRIRTRMSLHKILELKDYVEYIREDGEERQALFQDLLIKVTRFFRNPETFDALKASVFPRLMENRSPNDPIRVWIPGCSTGEEVYSIVICLLEYLADTPIKIFATDVSQPAIDRARSGVYPETISADVAPERLRRFFSPVDTGYKVAKTVRDTCVFARQDVIKDPPFSNLDFLSCRNLLIYFEPVLQQQVMPIFHYALKPGGFLMLGSSETIGHCAELFTLVDKKNRIYSRGPAPNPRMFGSPFVTHAVAPPREGRSVDEQVASTRDIQKEADRVVVGKYAPPGVIIDGDRNVLQFRGDTGEFLTPPPGAPTFDVLKMAREGLRLELHKAIDEALRQGGSVRKEGLRIRTNEHFTTVSLEVVPLGLRYARRPCLLIAFEHDDRRRETKARKRTRRNKHAANGPTTEELTTELEDTKKYLQSIIVELDTKNEELQAANEEIRAANEELQSTNEELETAKEELQATNEELTTVNEELQNRNTEMGKINDDLTNLISSVNIPIVMLGPDLSIRRFTPSAGKVFNFLPGDLGRPIADIKPTIHVADLEQWILEVLKHLTIKEAEVKGRDGHWYAMTIRPYRTMDNRIDGAVIALVDIDRIKRSEERVRESLEYAESIVETVRQPLLVLDKGLRVQKANRSFCEAFRVSREEILGRCIYELGDWQWDIPDLRRFLEEIITQNTSFEGYEVEHDFPTIGHKTMLLNARRMRGQEGGTELILLAIEECRQSQRLAAIGETVTGLAHESRNALQRSQAGLERLGRRMTGNPEATAILAQVQKAQDDLHRLYDDVREYSAPMSLEKGACDVAKIVEDAWLDLAPMREGREARIQQISAGLARECPVDAARFEQVIRNILENSLAATSGAVQIQIRYAEAELRGEPALCMAIRDNGPGLTPEEREKIFDAFFTTKIRGTGIGMAISKRIIEKHGGQIAVSDVEGPGTEIVITLPRRKG